MTPSPPSDGGEGWGGEAIVRAAETILGRPWAEMDFSMVTASVRCGLMAPRINRYLGLLATLATTADGAILCLAYATPLKVTFV